MNPKQLREQRRQQKPVVEQQTITQDDVMELPDELVVPGTPRIVSAVMSATSVNRMGGEQTKAERIERAMATAVEQALAEGVNINNADEIRGRMLDARQAVLDQEAELARLAEEDDSKEPTE